MWTFSSVVCFVENEYWLFVKSMLDLTAGEPGLESNFASFFHHSFLPPLNPPTYFFYSFSDIAEKMFVFIIAQKN